MSSNQRPKVAYSLSQPYFNASPIPITVTSDPKVTDFAELGTIWINKTTNKAWILTSVANNQAYWIEIDNSSTSANITWSIEAGVGPIALAGSHGYYLTNAAAVALTLPAIAVLGAQIYITTANASAALAGFTIAQNAGQYVLFGNNSSAIGIGGSVDATNMLQRSITMQLICTVANTEFTIFTSNVNPNLI